MTGPSPRRPRLLIAAHGLVVLGAGFVLVATHRRWLWAAGAIASGSSLFALTGLGHAASHRLLSRRRGLNDALGALAGWPLLTPLSAYRGFHFEHHRATNHDGDPNEPLNSRWMLLVGSPAYVALIHRHAWRTLRGRALLRYLAETLAMVATLALLMAALPHAIRERAWLLPLAVTALLQNLRIVTEHLDLPAGRFHDTWQLALPPALSRWLLHYDHHLEHHLRPGLPWHKLPRYRLELAQASAIPAPHQVTLARFARAVFLRKGPAPALTSPPSPQAAR